VKYKPKKKRENWKVVGKTKKWNGKGNDCETKRIRMSIT
jgi:hypothetical protein